MAAGLDAVTLVAAVAVIVVGALCAACVVVGGLVAWAVMQEERRRDALATAARLAELSADFRRLWEDTQAISDWTIAHGGATPEIIDLGRRRDAFGEKLNHERSTLPVQ